MSMSLVMKSVRTSGVDRVETVEIPRPAPGPRDVVVRVRACGIGASDVAFLRAGGLPRRGGAMRRVALGHEAAGEVVDYGEYVRGLAVGDRVVVNPWSAPTGIIGCGGTLGAMTEYLLVEDAVVGESIAVFPDALPYDVAALNEPMAVARHCVERAEARPQDKVAVFGAGPIGLGTTIWLKLCGVRHVVVADVVPERLARALDVGADAVIDCATENVAARLTDLHGDGADALGELRPATDVYIDAAGTRSVFRSMVASARWRAKLVVVALQKPVDEIDLSGLLRNELTVVASLGHPAEDFDVTRDLMRHRERFGRIISHRVPYAEARQAFELAMSPAAAEKVVVTFP
jgi:2-desacetyl-2-hydroxyethyl bacteriochlorophyllide A dehydrogenase